MSSLTVCRQVITCRLIFDVVKTLVERFRETEIDLLHNVVKGQHCFLAFGGFSESNFCFFFQRYQFLLLIILRCTLSILLKY